jgi:hypothetical protein
MPCRSAELTDVSEALIGQNLKVEKQFIEITSKNRGALSPTVSGVRRGLYILYILDYM